MQRRPDHLIQHITPEERAFCTKLAAINAAFEAARAGIPAKALGERAASIDELLDRYFVALTCENRSE